MFGTIGPQEVLIVLVIALVVLGPSRLPEVARSLGKGVKEFKEGINDSVADANAAEDDDDSNPSDEGVSARVRALPPAEPFRGVLPEAEPPASDAG